MELVLFKDLLEDDAEPQYGLLEDREEPSVICLCCGSAVEYDRAIQALNVIIQSRFFEAE